jgi:hypothetical protein
MLNVIKIARKVQNQQPMNNTKFCSSTLNSRTKIFVGTLKTDCFATPYLFVTKNFKVHIIVILEGKKLFTQVNLFPDQLTFLVDLDMETGIYFFFAVLLFLITLLYFIFHCMHLITFHFITFHDDYAAVTLFILT